MAGISGKITSLTPADGSTFPSGTSVPVLAKGEVTLDGQQPPQTTYRVTLRARAFDASTCTTSAIASSSAEYTTDLIKRTYILSEASGNITNDGVYRIVAEVVSEKKKPDGTFEPEQILATQYSTVTIGNVNATLPRAKICTGQNQPVTGCAAPVPAPGANVPLGTVPKVTLKIWTIGANSNMRAYQFVSKMVVTDPNGNVSEISNTQTLMGVDSRTLQLIGTQTTVAGKYKVQVTVKAKQSAPIQNPDCTKEILLDTFNYEFTVESSSSSSSSQSSESSSSSSESSDSSFSSPSQSSESSSSSSESSDSSFSSPSESSESSSSSSESSDSSSSMSSGSSF